MNESEYRKARIRAIFSAPINWIQWLTLLLLTVVAVTVPILFVKQDNISQHRNDALVAIICHIEKTVKLDKKLPVKIRQKDIRFYQNTLAIIHAPACKFKQN